MLSSSFEDDPFFSDSFIAHRESMRQMMRTFSEPFGRDLLSISDGRGRAHNHMGHDDGENSLTAVNSLVPSGSLGGMVCIRRHKPFQQYFLTNIYFSLTQTELECSLTFIIAF